MLLHHKPITAPPSAHRSLCTEPVGIPTLLQILPASTPHPPVFRRPSDPPAKPPQIYYRVQHWTATRERGETNRKMQDLSLPPFSPSQLTHSSPVISYILKNPVPDQFYFFLPTPRCNVITGPLPSFLKL